MRGQAAGFDIVNAEIRVQWAARLRQHEVDYLILDCLRPILDALGLDEHHDAGRFLVAFDALLREADCTESLVVPHMGHLGERSRGDSRLRDWPDVEWRLVRPGDEPASRCITAYDRDVDISESQLTYDADTRALTIAIGSRRDATTRDALADVLAVLAGASEPLSGQGLETKVKGAGSAHARAAIRDAIALGIRSGAIVTEPGPRGAILPSSSPACRSSLSARQQGECNLANPLGWRAVTDLRPRPEVSVPN
jgi:hypothetical protein